MSVIITGTAQRMQNPGLCKTRVREELLLILESIVL